MIIVDDFEQGGEEWLRVKAGVPSASNFSRIITAAGDPSKSQEEYIYELAWDRMLGRASDGYMSYDMKKGKEREPEAREFYEFITGAPVRQVAFVFKDENRNIGCSPDGLPEGTGLEIKCPKRSSHIKNLRNGGMPSDKYHQIQGSMWVCGFYTWQFLSYYPEMPPVIITVERDYKFTSNLEHEMESFLQELEETYDKLRRKHG